MSEGDIVSLVHLDLEIQILVVGNHSPLATAFHDSVVVKAEGIIFKLWLQDDLSAVFQTYLFGLFYFYKVGSIFGLLCLFALIDYRLAWKHCLYGATNFIKHKPYDVFLVSSGSNGNRVFLINKILFNVAIHFHLSALRNICLVGHYRLKQSRFVVVEKHLSFDDSYRLPVLG